METLHHTLIYWLQPSKDLDLKGTIITSVTLQGGNIEWPYKWTPKKEKKRGTHACRKRWSITFL